MNSWWGRKHTNADALSRLPYRQCGRETHETTPIATMTLMSTELSLRESQLPDPTIGPVRKESNQKPSADETKSMARASRRLFQIWDQLLVKDGVLYHQYVRPLDQESILQLVIPGAMQSEVIKYLHEGALGAFVAPRKDSCPSQREILLAWTLQRCPRMVDMLCLCFPEDPCS